jgi:hypothetical protein
MANVTAELLDLFLLLRVIVIFSAWSWYILNKVSRDFPQFSEKNSGTVP